MAKPTYEEQRGKNRDGKEVCSSLFVFHLNHNEGRRAGKSVVLRGSIQDPLKETSKHQLLFFPHTPTPLWHSVASSPHPSSFHLPFYSQTTILLPKINRGEAREDKVEKF